MIKGTLHKMSVQHAQPVQYQLTLNNHTITLNDFLAKKITLKFSGDIFCIQCSRKIKQSFQQGYCFPCMQKINDCNNCMIHPEKCLVETGQCDSSDWAHEHCHQEHVVYLANSSGLKVGVTRVKNMPSRWIDQGALQALPIFKTHNRFQAGLVEVALKNYVADKTNWRKMLSNAVVLMDLMIERNRLLVEAEKHIAPILKKYVGQISLLNHHTMMEFHYPVLEYPKKITSLSLDKTPVIEGVLQGIKGQYLMLDSGVLNVRKFGGYWVEVL